MVQDLRRFVKHRMGRWSGSLVAALLLAASAHPAQAIEDATCRDAGEMLRGRPSLPRTLAALRHQRRLTVVAIGSSSTQGYGAAMPNQAYPAQLAALLKLHFPHSAVHVVNKGVGGENIGDMINRFSRDVFPERPDLVIWQTGTNDAINQVPLEQFRALLVHGIRELHSRRIDVILMTPQYAPQFVGANGYTSYLTAMTTAAAFHKVAVFDRFEPTKRWATDRRFVDSPALTKDGLHLSTAGYHCTALLLAEELAALVNGR